MTKVRERTQDEIAACYRSKKPTDVLGFTAEILLARLDAEHFKEFARPEADLAEWSPTPTDCEAVMRELTEYMEFAWGKVQTHRGISAGRSVEKVLALAWLLGTDEVVAEIDLQPYAQYGAPKLARACRIFGLPIPESDDVANMIKGLPCSPGCSSGCGG